MEVITVNFIYKISVFFDGIRKRLIKPIIFLLILLSSQLIIGQSADLDQIRNGSITSPTSPGVWQNGNLTPTQAHLAEGFSVAYRVKLLSMPAGTSVTITLGYDVKENGKHAIDYLTHYDRGEPHNLAFGHTPREKIDPTIGVSGVTLGSSASHKFTIPTPPTNSTPMAGQPTASFNGVLAEIYDDGNGVNVGGAQMSIWNGTITNITYGTAANLGAASAEQLVSVTFTVAGSLGGPSKNVIIAWGGHIASRTDWGSTNGVPNSAGGISGSPYHMRLKGWSLGNLGQQDRSLKADAVIPPPDCIFNSGDDIVCEGGNASYSIQPVDAAFNPTYSWKIDQTGGIPAVFDPPNPTGTSATVVAGDTDFKVVATIVSNFGTVDCEYMTEVISNPDADELDDVTRCDSYELPPLSTGNAYWTGSGGTGSMLDAGDLITTSQTIYIYFAGVAPCAADESEFDVTINLTPEIPDIETQFADCIGGDGSFIFVGNPQELYISFDDGVTFDLYTGAISLPVGIHDFVVKFGNDGCVSEPGQVQIQQPPLVEFIIIAEAIEPDCETLEGSILIRIDGNEAPDTGFFNYTISSGGQNYYVGVKQPAVGFGGLPPGDYVVIGVSDNGCDSSRTEVTLEEPVCQEFEGCTLGYWKNHTNRWTCYSTCTLYSEVFGGEGVTVPSALQGKTLLEVLNLGGGGVYNLGRQSVAALLNTCHDDIFYEILSKEDLIAYVQDNFTNAGAAGSYLDMLNNAGCTLGGSRATTKPSEGCPTEENSRPGKGKPGKKSSVTSGFKASPVPFKDRLSIQYDFDYVSDVNIQVYDLRGQLLKTYKDKKVTRGDIKDLGIDFRMKANQVYILRVQTNREVFTQNIISAKK